MVSRINLTGPIEFKPENRKPRFNKERPIMSGFRKLRGRVGAQFSTGARVAGRSDLQRVVVKARSVKGRRNGTAASLRKHLSYLERSGVGQDGKKPEFVGRSGTTNSHDVRKEVVQWAGDHHHFRFIVSPERTEGVNLEQFAERLVGRMEDKLGTKLQWYGAAHHNTDNPHIHLMIRGKDDRGNDLILEKDFIKHGVRNLAEDLLTKEIGPRTIDDRKKGLENAIIAQYFTGIDRGIVNESENEIYRHKSIPARSRDWEKDAARRKLARLQFLASLGLAQEKSAGEWQISNSLEQDLRALSRRTEIQKRLSEHLKERLLGRETCLLLEPDDLSGRLDGRIIARGVANELTDEVFVAVEDNRGRIFYTELGAYSEPAGFEAKEDAIVRLEYPRHGRADDFIIAFAAERGGLFFIAEFTEQIKRDVESGKRKLPGGIGPEEYVAAYSERLANLTSLGFIELKRDGIWRIPENLKEVVDDHERKIGRKKSIQMTALSYLSINEQVIAQGSTWLDRILVSRVRNSGSNDDLGTEIEEALEKRAGILKERGLQIDLHLPRKLYAYELSKLENQLSTKFGEAQKLNPGSTVQGELVEYRLLSNGYHALIKRDSGFFVIPAPYRASRIEPGTQVEFGFKADGWKKSYSLKVYKGRPLERGA